MGEGVVSSAKIFLKDRAHSSLVKGRANTSKEKIALMVEEMKREREILVREGPTGG